MRTEKVFLLIGLVVSAVVFGWFLKISFEKNFPTNNLQEIDKEQLLFSENAFYFSFYKRLAETRDFWSEIKKMKADDRVLYPLKVNIFSEYTVAQEVLAAVLYKTVGGVINMDIFDFYMAYVMVFGIVGVIFLYLLVYEVGGGVTGSVIAVLFFLFSFPWSSRLSYLPVLRENFGVPLLVAQVYLMVKYSKKGGKWLWFFYLMATVGHIWVWQFSKFTLLVELAVLTVMCLFNKPRSRFIWLFGPIFLIEIIKFGWGGGGESSHVWQYVQHQLFNATPNFEVMMYKCNGAFEIISQEIIGQLSNNLLLPLMLMVILGILLTFRKTDVVVKLLLLLALGFGSYGILVNRFLVLAIPFWIVVVMIIFSKTFLVNLAGGKMGSFSKIFRVFMGLFLVGSWVLNPENGAVKLVKQESFGQFYPQSEPYRWIRENTASDSVFGGSIPLMSNVLLLTGRRIANNPFYEDAESRRKNYEIYRVYGRESEEGMYALAKKNGLDFLVVENNLCYQRNARGCLVDDLYITEDSGNLKPILCRILTGVKSKYFDKVFESGVYKIFRVLEK